MKYSKQEYGLIEETSEIYEAVARPYVEKDREKRL